MTNYFLHIEGMDLAGKSTVAKCFASTSQINWVIQDKRLSKNNPVYDFAWNFGKKAAYDKDVLGFLYLAALLQDIKSFKHGHHIIQDSTLLLRSLNYYMMVKKNDYLVESFKRCIPNHPRPDVSFYLTADIETRRKRLKERINSNPEKLTSMDLLIQNDPKKFIQIDESLQALSIDTFNSKVINTSKMTSFEVVQYIRKRCHLEMQR